MGTLLKVVGAVWAVLGVANLVQMDWTHLSEGMRVFGLMFNGLLFVLPGLILVGIGEVASRRKTAGSSPADNHAERLKIVDRLLSKGAISAEEHAARRAEILKQI